MAIRTYGPNAVDWEARVDVDRLRTDRLDRLRQHLDASELGSLLTFDFSNIRYMTATHIGTWAMDKLIRFALLPRGAQPVVWDFGSAATASSALQPLAGPRPETRYPRALRGSEGWPIRSACRDLHVAWCLPSGRRHRARGGPQGGKRPPGA